jgi:hypothetical protein
VRRRIRLRRRRQRDRERCNQKKMQDPHFVHKTLPERWTLPIAKL